MRWYWRCFSRSSAPWVRLPASCLPYLGEVVGGEVVGGVTLDKWLERGGWLPWRGASTASPPQSCCKAGCWSVARSLHPRRLARRALRRLSSRPATTNINVINVTTSMSHAGHHALHRGTICSQGPSPVQDLLLTADHLLFTIQSLSHSISSTTQILPLPQRKRGRERDRAREKEKERESKRVSE